VLAATPVAANLLFASSREASFPLQINGVESVIHVASPIPPGIPKD
jgi:hypothetical protein